MTDAIEGGAHRLSRQEISEAVAGAGWRYLLGTVRTRVAMGSLAQATEVAAAVVAAGGAEAEGSLWLDMRRDELVLTLQSLAAAYVTPHEIELAHRISSVVAGLGLATGPGTGDATRRSVQILEIGIDALDIPSIRPFWAAILGYRDEAGASGPRGPLADPAGQGPTIWFQQMDAPRPQRNRIHFDVSVPHDEAPDRLRAALAAGGTLLSDRRAPAFWVLADAEGNEACITTWQGRDG
jgi:4a-hydroxytetrahydrobiopterin dehydratase